VDWLPPPRFGYSTLGVALSEDGKARAGMGVDAADFDNSGRTSLAITNFEGEMVGQAMAAPEL